MAKTHRHSSSPAPTDPLAPLVRRIAAGEPAAMEQLYGLIARRVLGITFRVLGERSAAEEATMEVFVQVWRQAARHDAARGSVATWILTLARTRAIDLLRQRARQERPCPIDGAAPARVPIEMAAEQAEERPGPMEATALRERATLVRRAMHVLPARQREALEAAFFLGLSHSEVARHLGEPLGTIKTRIRSGLASLRASLGEAG